VLDPPDALVLPPVLVLPPAAGVVPGFELELHPIPNKIVNSPASIIACRIVIVTSSVEPSYAARTDA
jgi:hypothetical protein